MLVPHKHIIKKHYTLNNKIESGPKYDNQKILF